MYKVRIENFYSTSQKQSTIKNLIYSMCVCLCVLVISKGLTILNYFHLTFIVDIFTYVYCCMVQAFWHNSICLSKSLKTPEFYWLYSNLPDLF